jgi:hypothetical protein
MDLFSLMYKMPSGRMAMETLRGIGGIGTDNTAVPVKDMDFNFLVPTETAINDWDKKHAVDPDFKLGVSIKTAQHICKTTKGPLRIAMDATDGTGSPEYESNGTFARGDVYFPGCGYDADALSAQYNEHWKAMLPFVKDPKGISEGGEKVEKYLAACDNVASFLEGKVPNMEANIAAIKSVIEGRKDKYTKKQLARKGGKAAVVEPTEEWRKSLKVGSPIEVLYEGKHFWLAQVSDIFKEGVWVDYIDNEGAVFDEVSSTAFRFDDVRGGRAVLRPVQPEQQKSKAPAKKGAKKKGKKGGDIDDSSSEVCICVCVCVCVRARMNVCARERERSRCRNSACQWPRDLVWLSNRPFFHRMSLAPSSRTRLRSTRRKPSRSPL